ncbi:glycogen/starch/alpha-glucan phosphorylase [Alteribacillus bidgolensis]|uniref:Alpha-1,4 glucan phosphorylase n=1 Tax=Alteribacillus bidgolensis TaxID=930129 RepID=A0A1G8N148_9BACI|nr:glycogen/starch/alpha-glucan phosphorylase [Alteribacillus bidgolensis]SDI73320.1 starch phosphorylase [Alteribacillus bidgolensis]
MKEKEIQEAINSHLETKLGISVKDASNRDIFIALSCILTEKINVDWKLTQEFYDKNNEKQVYYFSMEFLLGKLMKVHLLNLQMLEPAKKVVKKLGFTLDEVLACEHDAGLGNGGLGRLAACFLDSMASLQIPGHGCGIRYKYGLFEQRLINRNQVELPDYWLKDDYVWEHRKPDESVEVKFGGTINMKEENGRLQFYYENAETVRAVPFDVPITGYNNQTVNTLRLWSAESSIDAAAYSQNELPQYNDYLEYKRSIEQISEFLYPDDSHFEGKKLRLKQQYFLVSAGLQSIIRSFKTNYFKSLSEFSSKVAIQINDTHPSLVVPELMRLLMDEEEMGWEQAWSITTQTVAYTNHTTLSEALETWPVDLFSSLLPRIYMIVEEINERFCQNIWFDHKQFRNEIPELAIISYGQIKMAHLAIVGSHSVNGVAKIHTDILKNKEMKHFYRLYPAKFNNKTNGITHRRWLLQINPELSRLITSAIGNQWKERPKDLIKLIRYAEDPSFQLKAKEVKTYNKQRLARIIKAQTGLIVNDQSIFDVHIKRLHGYKRQLLNIFHIIYLYNTLKENPDLDIIPRTFIFGAKAAPGYYFAKQVIRFILSAADIINNDDTIQNKLKVVFLENYNITLAEKIIPAADVSEQISTASKEASGTGNMKMMMNGALTLGTLDGANIEIKDMVGENNIFTFGLTSDEVLHFYHHGGYNAQDLYQTDERLQSILNQLHDGFFGNDEKDFKDIYYNLLSHNDEFFVLKDFNSYEEMQEFVDQTYRNQQKWMKMSITNIAHSGKFSSDRTIHEYASEIWKVSKSPVFSR